MKILVCGGLHYANEQLLFSLLDGIDCLHVIETVAHGGATGADALADKWARLRNKRLAIYRANWAAAGRAAEPIRNQRMLHEFKPDAVVACPGGRGMADMVRRAEAAGYRVIWCEAAT